ncbi:unnamed protein product, partial [Soboliphyme baturini]|uniref:Kinesin motor domain-containing protein n=1 Tax=Soboliphyme baturini TaxID=241478 RepID=A0A183IVM3_9BILA
RFGPVSRLGSVRFGSARFDSVRLGSKGREEEEEEKEVEGTVAINDQEDHPSRQLVPACTATGGGRENEDGQTDGLTTLCCCAPLQRELLARIGMEENDATITTTNTAIAGAKAVRCVLARKYCYFG